MAKQTARPKITIDDHFFRDPRFRPPQVLRICRVERDNLLDWHRRDLIPETRPATGRGHRRLYSVRDAIYINTVRILAEADAPLKEAALLASDMVDVVTKVFTHQWTTAVDFPLLPDCFVVMHRDSDGKWHHEWLGALIGEPLPKRGLQQYMRESHLESAVVLDINSIVCMLFDRILTEMGAIPPPGEY
jgi:hypothetical protein